jgi:hypothetical protein
VAWRRPGSAPAPGLRPGSGLAAPGVAALWHNASEQRCLQLSSQSVGLSPPGLLLDSTSSGAPRRQDVFRRAPSPSRLRHALPRSNAHGHGPCKPRSSQFSARSSRRRLRELAERATSSRLRRRRASAPPSGLLQGSRSLLPRLPGAAQQAAAAVRGWSVSSAVPLLHSHVQDLPAPVAPAAAEQPIRWAAGA